MRILPICRKTVLGLLALLLIASSFCYGELKTVEVIGTGECGDCLQKNIESSHAFNGLQVTIDCKASNGELKTKGTGKLDENGKFVVALPEEMIEDGNLKEECFAQLHSASNLPCAAHDTEAAKVVFKSKSNDGMHTFTPTGKLKFSSEICTSAGLVPFFKFPPPVPKFPFKKHPWFKPHPFPKKKFPPFFKKPCPPPIPIYKKPLPPPVPIVKPLPPPVPIVKPLPPPIPIKKPCPPPIPKPLPPPVPIKKPCPPPIPKPLPPPVPIEKPLPPPVPIEKPHPPPVPIEKPLPPPVPIKKPCPPPIPKPLPPPVPFYKPIPPIPKIHPPIYKKPCPPFPPKFFPPIYKKPFPPKPFEHPKFKHLPPIPFVPPHA